MNIMDFELTNAEIMEIIKPVFVQDKEVAKAAQRKLVEWIADRMCHCPESDLFAKEGTSWFFRGHSSKDTYCIDSAIWQELRRGVGL